MRLPAACLPSPFVLRWQSLELYPAPSFLCIWRNLGLRRVLGPKRLSRDSDVAATNKMAARCGRDPNKLILNVAA